MTQLKHQYKVLYCADCGWQYPENAIDATFIPICPDCQAGLSFVSDEGPVSVAFYLNTIGQSVPKWLTQ
jgi:NAD-dependent SIR2 family protein deacetylase